MASPQPSTPKQPHKVNFPCPICTGYITGKGNRHCDGFTSGNWAHCSQKESNLPDKNGRTWAHFIGERQQQFKGRHQHHAQETRRTFEYRLNGELRYQAVRIDKPEPDGKGKDHSKINWLESWDGQNWVKSMQGVERFPYRVDDLKRYPDAVVYIPEGEPKVDALRKMGLIAVSNTEGAKKWDGEHHKDSPYLKDRHVVILPDNDNDGQEHAQNVAEKLAHIASSIKVVTLPDLPPKGDIVDWIAAGGTKEKLLELVAQAEEWTHGKEDTAANDAYSALLAKYTFSLEDLLLEAFQPLKWAVEGLIPEGLTIFAGKPKVGKSWMMLAIALAIAYGDVALGQIQTEPGDVLYLALEDRKKRLQSRARKIGALRGKCGRFTLAVEWERLGNGGKEMIEAWIKHHPEARLVVVDTLAKIKPRTNDRQTLYDTDYQSIEPLQALSQQYSIPIVVVTHLRKMDAEDSFDTISGTLGLTGAADNLLVLKKQRGKADAVLCGSGREGDEFEKVVRFDPASCLWTLQGDAESYVPTEERRRIIEVLTKVAPKALSAPEIARQIDGESKNVAQLLFKLKIAGVIISPSYGKYTLSNKTDKTDKTGEGDEADKTSEPEPEEPESYQDMAGDKTADKTSETSAADVDSSFTSFTTFTDIEDFEEQDELSDTGKQRLIDLQEELKRRRTPPETPKPDARATIDEWAKERGYPPLQTPYGNFKDKRDWQIDVSLLSQAQKIALAAFLSQQEEW